MRTPKRNPSARPVPSDVYTEEYFRTAEAGFHAWQRSEGRQFGGFYLDALRIRQPRKGERILDVGTGRGEIPILAAENGAYGVGVDYSEASMQLARVTYEARGRPALASYARTDATRLPFPSDTFHVVYAMDFVEHLTPAELDKALREIARVLVRGGAIVVHTMPNRLVYDVTYRWFRRAFALFGRRWPDEPRTEYEVTMHVNEMSRRQLSKALRRAGLKNARTWLGGMRYVGHLPSWKARRLVRLAGSVPGLRGLAVADLWAVAARPPDR